MILYGMPAITASLAAQYFLFRSTTPLTTVHLEHTSSVAFTAFYIINLIIMQCFGLRSAYLFFNMAVVGVVILGVNELIRRRGVVDLFVGHVLWSGISLILGTEAVTNVSLVFSVVWPESVKLADAWHEVMIDVGYLCAPDGKVTHFLFSIFFWVCCMMTHSSDLYLIDLL